MKLAFIFLLICLVSTGRLGWEEEIQGKIKSFVKGKDLKVLFKKYATNGYIKTKGMNDFLIDIGVSEWCQWPTLVLAELDPNNDGKLSLEEI